MKTIKKPFSVIGLILSVFFSAIILYIIFGVFDVYQWALALPFIIAFVAINLLLLIALSSFGGVISERCGVPALCACWVVFGIYTAIQFLSTFVFIATVPFTETSSFYILGNLIFLFLSLLVTLPILASGAKRNNK